MPWWWDLWKHRNDAHEPDPEGWYLLAEEVRAQHPGIELFLVHPELGLKQLEEGLLEVPTDLALGTRWMALTVVEQRLRLRDMLRALLQHAAAGEAAQFHAWVHDVEATGESTWMQQLAALDDARTRGEPGLPTIEAALSPAAIELLCDPPADGEVLVKRDGRLWCAADADPLGDRPHAISAWLDPWHTDELERELSAAWWTAAEARLRAAEGGALPGPSDGGRVSRETRAELLVTWHRAGRGAMVPLVPLGIAVLPLPAVLAAVVTLIAVMLVLSPVGRTLRWWYQRS